MSAYRPTDGFRTALTAIDADEADLIVTMVVEAADWAEQHGYRVVRDETPEGTPIFEIWGGDGSVVSHQPRAVVYRP